MKKNKKFKPRSRDDNKNSPFEDRKKFCPFSQKNSPIIDYKDVKLLNRYVSEKGKITPFQKGRGNFAPKPHGTATYDWVLGQTGDYRDGQWLLRPPSKTRGKGN